MSSTRQGQKIIVYDRTLTVEQAEALSKHITELCRQARVEFGWFHGVCRSRWHNVRIERWSDDQLVEERQL